MSAKTIEAAIELGLDELNARQDEVEVEVLEVGGLFKKAKVRLTMKAGVVQETKVEVAPLAQSVKEDKVPDTPKVEARKEEKKVESRKDEKKSKGDAPAPASAPKPAPKKVDTGDMTPKLYACVNFVTKLLELLENDSTVTIESTDKAYTINIRGESIGRLIGKGGEALNALQALVSSIAISHQNGEAKRVYINIEDYKERREETLKKLAKKKADYVKESGRYVKLEPMCPRDRAIIHTAIQDIEGVRSYSTGEGNARRLVIAPQGEQRAQGDPGLNTQSRNDKNKSFSRNKGKEREATADTNEKNTNENAEEINE